MGPLNACVLDWSENPKLAWSGVGRLRGFNSISIANYSNYRLLWDERFLHVSEWTFVIWLRYRWNFLIASIVYFALVTVSCMFQLRHLWERTSTSSGWGFMERGRQEGWYIQDVGSQSFSRSCHLRRKQSLPDCVFKSYMGNSCMLPMPNWCLIGLYKHNGNGHGNLPIEPSLLLSHSICVCVNLGQEVKVVSSGRLTWQTVGAYASHDISPASSVVERRDLAHKTLLAVFIVAIGNKRGGRPREK